MFYPSNLPREIKVLPQWVCYNTKFNGTKTNKYMISPVTGGFAKSNSPETWSTFYTALKYMEKNKMQGLAFVLSNDYVFIDIDHCITNGEISELAKDVLNEFPNTYAEKSVSGRGIHILCKGKLPEVCNKRNDEIGLEMYDTKRFMCVTGDSLDCRTEILDYSFKIQEFNEKYMGKKEVAKNPVALKSAIYEDYELIHRIRASRQRAKFDELFSGNISRYPSHSNADFAFVKLLTFWTQDKEQIDSIFRTSGLMREKWDKHIGDSTYGEITINNALGMVQRVYAQRTVSEM